MPEIQAALRQPRASPRALAEEHRAGPREASAPIDPVGHILAGFAAGFVAGYVSHLLLDGMTPAGLPTFA